jgi:hypothetical protein
MDLDWVVYILFIVTFGIAGLVTINYFTRDESEDKGDLWVPTQAEMHAQQHEDWEAQFDALLPEEERIPPMAEILRLKDDLQRKLIYGEITGREYNRVRSQLDVKAKERFTRLQQGAIDALPVRDSDTGKSN